MERCPDPETLARFADGKESEPAAAELRAHVDGCAACREVLTALALGSRAPGAGGGTRAFPEGVLMGRYEVLERLGSGGMGVVVAAWDKQLGRKVALKVVRPELEAGPAAEQSRARMVREAQLMAQVNHPAVVTVYDVGNFETGFFISMELIPGQTLRGWLKSGQRSWRETVRLFLRAGQGLIAAHAAGLVHRDFKPDNVLVDPDGGVHVTDFGLAWSAQAQPLPVPGTALVSPSVSSGLSRQTAVLGTPAYMAPEQLRGQTVDARADQFSFCVALWEAVFGARPFQANHTSELLAAIEKGPSPIRGRWGWLEAALRRGLAVSPEDRFQSLAELTATLEKGLARPRQYLFLGGAAVVLAVVARLTLGPSLFGSACEESAGRVAHLWSAEARSLAEQKFKSSGAESWAKSWQQTSSTLDRWAQGWSQAWKTSCEPKVSNEARARASLCLDARLADFEVLVELFKNADDGVVSGAQLALTKLYSPEPCLAGETLTTAPLPESPAQRLLAARSRLLAAQSEAMRLAGRHAAAMRLAKESVEAARNSTWRPAEAEALLALAEEQRARANYGEAAKTLNDALVAAESGRHFEAIARIATQQVFSLGSHSEKPEEAEAWLTRAKGALEQMPRPELASELLLATAFLRTAQGKPEEAVQPAADAAAEFARLNRGLRALDAKGIQAQALALLGRAAEAVPVASQVRDGRSELLGKRHPQTVRAFLDVGTFLAESGKLSEGVDAIYGALQMAEQVGVAPVSKLVAANAMGRALTWLGRHDEAVGVHRSVIAGIETALGNKHRYAALAHDALALALREAGSLEEARLEHVKAQEIWDGAEGGSGAERASSHAAYAWTLLELGQYPLVREEAAKALSGEPGAQRGFPWVVPITTARAASALAMLAQKQELKAALAEAELAVSAAGETKGPDAAVARARALMALGDASGGNGAESYRRALEGLRAADPKLAPGLQAKLSCKLGEKSACK
jgi:eukaryotic-like serine/threonine-protein kinase